MHTITQLEELDNGDLKEEEAVLTIVGGKMIRAIYI